MSGVYSSGAIVIIINIEKNVKRSQKMETMIKNELSTLLNFSHAMLNEKEYNTKH